MINILSIHDAISPNSSTLPPSVATIKENPFRVVEALLSFEASEISPSLRAEEEPLDGFEDDDESAIVLRYSALVTHVSSITFNAFF